MAAQQRIHADQLLVDTVAVILITHFYAQALPIDAHGPLWPQLSAFIGAGYAYKVLTALVDTAPFYLGVHGLRRWLRLPPPGEESRACGDHEAPAPTQQPRAAPTTGGWGPFQHPPRV